MRSARVNETAGLSIPQEAGLLTSLDDDHKLLIQATADLHDLSVMEICPAHVCELEKSFHEGLAILARLRVPPSRVT